MNKRRLSIMVLLIILAAFTGMTARAAKIHVTTTQDSVEGSLREAINTANSNTEDDTIYLPAGTYILSGEAEDDFNLGGDLDIDNINGITIVGDGATITIIDGDLKDRVVHILNGTVTISGVTFQNGLTPHKAETLGTHAGSGGGIKNNGILTLTDCNIINNSTGSGGYCTRNDYAGDGGHGGGIYNSGTLSLTDCTVENNTAGRGGAGRPGGYCYYGDGGKGGGICNTGTQILTNCNISNNKAGTGGSDGSDSNWAGNGGDGGGIFNSGNQTITNCTINFNISGEADFTDWTMIHSGHGGAVCNESGQSDISNCIMGNNATGPARGWNCNGGNGGAVHNGGTMSITDTTIWYNNVANGKDGGHGGGISNDGSLTLDASTVCNNYTSSSSIWLGHGGSGGGIYNTGELTLINSTVSTNYTGSGKSYDWDDRPGNGGNGGGICNYGTAVLNLTNSTICNNNTGGIGEEYNIYSRPGQGGGLYNLSGTVNIRNTIIADNTVDTNGEGPDCYGTLQSNGYNLIENTANCSINGTLTGNISGLDPGLGPLTDNGGITRTHALLPESPAIDKGYSPDSLVDQRNAVRPLDVPGIDNAADGSDIGAFEFADIISISGTVTDNATGLPDVTLTFSNNGGTAVTDANGNYSHSVQYGWAGTVTPEKKDYRFTPENRSYTNVTGLKTNQDYTANSIVPPQISLNRERINFGIEAVSGSPMTTSETLMVSNIGGGTLNWSITTTVPWISCTPVTGGNSATVTVTVDASLLAAGSHKTTLTIEDPNAANSPRSAMVNITVYAPGTGQQPFGCFDTPQNGDTVTGSVAVTGWALDDIGIESVKIYRDPVQGEGNTSVYIGQATCVEGARPDVESTYQDYPGNYKAGWGYMMLTNFLPSRGNGTFVLHARALDKEGNTVTLGSKTIYCDNDNAVKPFGAIDTPAQGGIASGSQFINFGWALTPLPNTIPIDGSTITVWIDGVAVGHPTYNQYREDIATLFPGYNNTNGAVGYFYIDTSTYDNGVHTIQWTVTDNAQNTDGIGSRFFTVNNILRSAGGLRRLSEGQRAAPFGIPVSLRESRLIMEDWKLDLLTPICFKKGFDKKNDCRQLFAGENNRFVVNVNPVERLEIRLWPDEYDKDERVGFEGYGMNTGRHGTLPVGSTLDTENGVFYWMPGPGFAGKFNFEFFKIYKDGTGSKKEIVIIIGSIFEKENPQKHTGKNE
jgi:hypothetical protein